MGVLGGRQSGSLCSHFRLDKVKYQDDCSPEQASRWIGSFRLLSTHAERLGYRVCTRRPLPPSLQSYLGNAAGNMSPQHTDSAAPSERTPLIPPAPSALPSPSPTLAPSDSPKHSSSSPGSTSTGLFPPIRRVLFTSFLLSMTFAFTQTSLIYAFRTMTCDEWYKTHPFPGQVGDICATPAIDARTAKSVALMSSVTTTCSEWLRGGGFILEIRVQ